MKVKTKKSGKLNSIANVFKPTGPKTLVTGFAVLILFGALILSLDCCQKEPVGFLDALFISTSASTVTGLSTI
ncbi:MAG: hypothetical protein MJ246_02275 [Clostridia bacterium]|nr:hypothetical protein [Clostridia bacterium]